MNSYKNLSSEDQENIELRYPKKYLKIFKNSTIETYMPQLICKLSSNQIFDSYTNEVHFKNGYYDLKDGVFKKKTYFW